MDNKTFGKVLNRARHSQCMDMGGLRYGSITPSDIDAVIEYHDKAWVVVEVKYRGQAVAYGQKLALTRLINDLSVTGKPALGIIADHYVEDVHQDVNVAGCPVREIKFGAGPWEKPAEPITVRAAIDKFLEENGATQTAQ